jgi:predicted protein tyrosine phosphatase
MSDHTQRVVACPVLDCSRPPASTPPFCERHTNYSVVNGEGEPIHPSKAKVLVNVTATVTYDLHRTVAMTQEEYLELHRADVNEDQETIDGIVHGWLEADIMDAINGSDRGDEFEDHEFSLYRPDKHTVEKLTKARARRAKKQ